MPQLDFYSFPIQTNFSLLSFFILYFVCIKVLLTYILVNAKLRERVRSFTVKNKLLFYLSYF